MTIKLIVSDMDGTLLNENHKVSEETANALRTATKEGIRFIVATGRSYSTAYPILKEVGIACDLVLLNGAEFRDSEGRLIYGEAIPNESAQSVISYLQDKQVDYEINTEFGDYSTDTEICVTASPMPEMTEFWNGQPIIRKIFAFSSEQWKLEDLRKVLNNYEVLSVTSSSAWNVEITSSKAQKGIMVVKAAKYYGIPEDQVVVFGDGENDKTMFQKFDHSCAMKNAILFIRDLAEKTIESNQEDGVAKEIRRILKGDNQYGNI